MIGTPRSFRRIEKAFGVYLTLEPSHEGVTGWLRDRTRVVPSCME